MSYGTNQGLEDWLTAQGLTLPVGADPTVLRNIGSAYVDSAYGYKLTCSQKAGGFAQELEWPRVNHVVNGEVVPDDLIPAAWINASYRAAYLQSQTPGWATTGVDASRQTKRERVDTIEREFFSSSEAPGSSAAPGFPSDSIINGMVLPWLCSNVRRADSLFRII